MHDFFDGNQISKNHTQKFKTFQPHLTNKPLQKVHETADTFKNNLQL